MSQLKVDSIIPTTGVPTGGGGGIVQVKNTTVTDTDTLSCISSWEDSEITCSITPTSSSSKILISMSATGEGNAQNHQAFSWTPV